MNPPTPTPTPTVPAERKSRVVFFTVAVATAVLVTLAAVLMQGYYEETVTAERTRKALDGRLVERRSLEAKHRDQLSTYHFADPESRTRVVVPIERAMELCASELAAAHPGQPATLVPAVTPAHDQPTAPAIWGRPTGSVAASGGPP